MLKTHCVSRLAFVLVLFLTVAVPFNALDLGAHSHLSEYIVPEIDVSPTSIDFGSQQIGTTSPGVTVTISNTGTTDLHISTVVTLNFVFSIVNSPAGTTITPGNSAQFTITFSPPVQAIYTSHLVISSDAADESTFVVPLSGTGVNNPEIGVSPTSIFFGNQIVGTTSSPQTVTVSNTGTGDLHISSVFTGNAAFTITNSPAGTTITPGTTAQFTVRFSPPAPGAYSTNLFISSDDADESTVVVPLQGTGMSPPPLVVDNTSDNAGFLLCSSAPNDCSLRGAIANANSNANQNVITFLSPLFDTPQTITLVTSQLDVTAPLTINGPGADKLTISGNNARRIFSVGVSATLSLSALKITEGIAELGGAIFVNQGSLNVDRCTLSHNLAIGGIDPAGRGGAIYIHNAALLTLTNSTLSDNFADIDGGALHTGDVTSAGATIAIANSTFSGNGAVVSGGAIYNNAPGNLMQVVNSTIAYNAGGGISGFGEIGSTIIATTPNGAPDVAGTFLSLGYNLIGNAGTAVGFFHPTDQVGPVPPLSPKGGSTPLDPGLLPLANNGGPTQTHSLSVQPVSPAIDKGLSGGQTTDQRGFARTFDNPTIPNAAGGDGTDVGAYERLAPTAANVSLSGRVLTASGAGIRGVKVTLSGGNLSEPITVWTSSFGYFSFEDITSGFTYIVTVGSRRYSIAEPSRVVNLVDAVVDFDFVAEPWE